MSERRENSVLVALRELRGIEDDRVKREQEEARAEAERAAKAESERRTASRKRAAGWPKGPLQRIAQRSGEDARTPAP